MADNEKIMFMLGEIKGKLDGMDKAITETKDTVVKIDNRVRKVEIRAAINGGAFGVGASLLVMSLKEMFKQGGSS